MTQWATFVGITGVVLVLLLVLSHLTQSSFDSAGAASDQHHEAQTGPAPADASTEGPTEDSTAVSESAPLEDSLPENETSSHNDARGDDIDPSDLSSGMVLANVALSQGLFAFVLIGAAVYTAIPASALGIEFSRSYLVMGLLVGALAGLVLYVANEIGAAVATRVGFTHDEQLRELLAPESARGGSSCWSVCFPLSPSSRNCSFVRH